MTAPAGPLTLEDLERIAERWPDPGPEAQDPFTLDMRRLVAALRSVMAESAKSAAKADTWAQRAGESERARLAAQVERDEARAENEDLKRLHAQVCPLHDAGRLRRERDEAREQVRSLTERLGAVEKERDNWKAEWSEERGDVRTLRESVRSLTVERDAALERAESAEGELDDLSTLVHYDGGDSRGHLGECFSSVMDQWRHGRAAFKALRAATTPKEEAQAICDLYGALFPDESNEDAPTEPEYEEEVDRLTEAADLRARLSRAREALAEWLTSVDGREQHSLQCWNHGSGRIEGQPCVCGFAALRGALSEPPGETRPAPQGGTTP